MLCREREYLVVRLVRYNISPFFRVNCSSVWNQNIEIGHTIAAASAKICQMFVYSGHALSYTKLVHRHATETEGNKYFK